MTDKQIIFDDVDVKNCISYAKSQEIYLGNTLYKQMEKVCMVKNLPCKFFDCQFKQMARELKAKEQECEELKKLVKVRIEDLCESCGASSMMPMPCKVYEKTLTEIKEIIHFNKTNRLSGGAYISIEQILQKISECEVEND